MTIRRSLVVLAAALAFGLAGCGGDVAGQLGSNEQLRTQVLNAIAQNKDLALQTVDRLMASDSIRTQVVDKMLANDEGAKQVLGRIAGNPEALDMVIGAAVRDSAMRSHVLTLVRGIEMAGKAK